MPCAFLVFVAGDLERIRCSRVWSSQDGWSSLPYQSAHRARFQLLEPCSRREARGRFGVAWAVGQWAFFPSKASAFAGGARREKFVSRQSPIDRTETERTGTERRAIGTGRSGLSMRCLVQGGQEQELSLGCGCWSLAKSVASHVVEMVGQMVRWTAWRRCQDRGGLRTVPEGRRCLPLVRLVQPPAPVGRRYP